MAEVALAAASVHHRYGTAGGPEILRGADLELHAGASVAVTGVSGCGKSTLLHILGGLISPTAGSVTVAGTALAGMGPAALGRLRNRRLGFVYQSNHLLAELTAIENAALPGLVAGTSWPVALLRAREVLASVNIVGLDDRYPAQLSGGERQRVAIARALANDPDCVLADEPTGNLDRDTAAAVAEVLLGACAAHNCAVLIATHDLELASRLDRQLRLCDGMLTPATS